MRSSTLAVGLLVAGLLAFLGLRVINDRDDWVLLSADLPLAAGESWSKEFMARRDGYLTIEIEVDAAADANLLKRYVVSTESPSELDVRWEVQHDGRAIAAGDARDYLYVEQMPSLLGRLRRIIMQVPFNRSATHWNSLGIAGSRSIARGIGRFKVTADAGYSISITTQDNHSELDSFRPVVSVRVEPRTWSRRYDKVRVLGYLGLALIVAGISVAVASRLRAVLLSR